jgi:hypothetical protein
MARAYAPGSLLFYFASYIARHLVGISVGIGSNRRRKLLYIQMVMAVVEYRPGAPDCARFLSTRLVRASSAGLPRYLVPE